MTILNLEDLPLPQRLALAHAPVDSRQRAIAAFAFDARLARFVAQATEPMVAQLRLAWWRDQLALLPEGRAKGDAVLDGLSQHLPQTSDVLSDVVDGWETLVVGDTLAPDVIDGFGKGRARLFAAVLPHDADRSICEQVARAGSIWALADLAATQVPHEVREAIVSSMSHEADEPLRLPRSLRHLQILGELGRSSISRGGAPLVARRRDALAISRLGLFGR